MIDIIKHLLDLRHFFELFFDLSSFFTIIGSIFRIFYLIISVIVKLLFQIQL